MIAKIKLFKICLIYFFQELQAINRMLLREQAKPITAGKRLLVEDLTVNESPAIKRPLIEKPQILKRMEEVMNDRGAR